MDDIKVIDEEYESYCTALSTFGETMEKRVKDYVTSMEAIGDYVITEGQVASNLKLFTMCASGLQGLSGEVIKSMKDSLTNLVSDIDDADSFIY